LSRENFDERKLPPPLYYICNIKNYFFEMGVTHTMKKTAIVLGITAVVIGGVLFSSQSVLAYKGDPNVNGPNYTAERHTAIAAAFAKKDFNAWTKLMEGRGAAKKVTAQNFAKFVEAHNLAEAGKTDAANKIRAELGLGQKNGTGMGR
jgi:hypothetical protein